MEALKDHNYALPVHSENFCTERNFNNNTVEQTTKLFNCTQNSPEKYECRTCGFKTNMRIWAHKTCPIATLSLNTIPLLRSYVCQNCNFETYSWLIYMKHIDSKCSKKSDLPAEYATHKPYNNNNDHNYCKENRAPLHQFESVYVTEDHSALITDTVAPSAHTNKIKNKIAKRKINKWHNCDQCHYRNTKYKLQQHLAQVHGHALDDVKIFYCRTCPFWTGDPSVYAVHNHVIRDKYVVGSPKPVEKKPPLEKQSGQAAKCRGCSFVAPSHERLTEHLFNTHRKPSIIYKCKKCTFESREIALFKFHALTKHRSDGLQEYECYHCLFKTVQVQVLGCHIRSKHLQNSEENSVLFLCNQCPFLTPSRQLLKGHVNKAHLVKCAECNYSAMSKEDLDHHVATVHCLKECEFCSFTTIFAGGLLKHMVEKHQKCERCSYVAPTLPNLRKHMLEDHEVDLREKGFKCSQCSFRSESVRALSKHCLASHEVKWYECEGCSYRDKVKVRIEEHIMKEHTNAEEAFRCEDCSFKTGRKGDLDQHYVREHCKFEVDPTDGF